jgi:signal transduction histidine kinase|uniref:sensor histidine kinase n=1 Tax=Prosthecobacter sp. TaxID=1965333 RepID=UPI003783AF4F
MEASPEDLAQWLGMLEDDSLPVDWQLRQEWAEAVSLYVRSKPVTAEALALIQKLSQDAKWEVRLGIARRLISFPLETFESLVSQLAQDANAYVSEAARVAMARRVPRDKKHGRSRHTDIQSLIAEIDRTYGAAATKAATAFADRQTNEVLLSVAHDIKTILTSVLTSLDGLTCIDALPKADVTRIKKIRQGLDDLQGLLFTINTFSRSIRLVLREEDIGALAAEAAEKAQENVVSGEKDAGVVEVTLDIPAGLRARVSRPHLMMVLTNTIQNGIECHEERLRFRPGSVKVSACIEAGVLRMTISDTGAAVDARQLAKLQEFIPGNSAKSNGTGFGLPIAKRYIEDHGGTLRLSMIEGVGLVVEIHLPTQTPP